MGNINCLYDKYMGSEILAGYLCLSGLLNRQTEGIEQMKKNLAFTIFIGIVVFLRCSSTTGGLTALPEVQDDNIMVIGDIILENINQKFAFVNWDLPFKVILLSKLKDGTIKRYELYTDDHGYFALPNVPRAPYLLKAIVFQEPGSRPQIIVNSWRGIDSKFYRMRHPERGVDNTAAWFPPTTKKRLVNMGIYWFGLRTAAVSNISEEYVGEVLVANFDHSIKAKRMWDKGYPFTRQDPLEYFRNKFPDSGWWKE